MITIIGLIIINRNNNNGKNNKQYQYSTINPI